MPKFGIPIAGNSPLFEYPLGQCLLYFSGFLLGKTTDDTILKLDRDIKDIMFSQTGTKAVDWVCTGELYSVEATMGETTEELISILDKSWVVDNVGNAFLKKDLYESYLANRAAELKIVKVDGNGTPISGDTYTFNFYQAVPIVNGDIMQFGADSQKGLKLLINITSREFTAGESSTYSGGYGYIGDPTVLDVPAIEWPPIPQTATVTGLAGTDLDIVFDRDIEFPTGSYVASLIEVIVNGSINVIAANTIIATTTLTIDISATGENISINPGDTVTVNILPLCIRGESDNKPFPFVTGLPTLNSAT